MRVLFTYLILSLVTVFLLGCHANKNIPLQKIEQTMALANNQDQFLLADAKVTGHEAYQKSLKYALGDGVNQDLQRSLMWMIYAAEHNCREAQFKLGLIYFQGIGVTVNAQLGFYWINMSAHSNFPEAEYYLGYMYNNGIGAIKNKVLGNYWKNKGKTDGACKGGNNKDNLICLGG
jgi:TPR repeat protein